LFGNIFANVFVADRMNDRLVKLDLVEAPVGWGESAPRLEYGGEYSGRGVGMPFNQTLNQPVGVALFRHYIFVGEATGNAITVLMVNHTKTDKFVFVSRLRPLDGIQLTGNIATTPLGYVWYTYVELPAKFAVASLFLAEEFRESREPTRFHDFLTSCVNDTWYNGDLRWNHTLYYEHLGFIMNATETNWLKSEEPDFFNIMDFNLSYSFRLDLLNSTIFEGTMVLCQPPPPPTQPPMLSGGTQGWNVEGMSDAQIAGARARCSPLGSSLQLGLLFLSYGLWLLRGPSRR
jgi:hypothetical protein